MPPRTSPPSSVDKSPRHSLPSRFQDQPEHANPYHNLREASSSSVATKDLSVSPSSYGILPCTSCLTKISRALSAWTALPKARPPRRQPQSTHSLTMTGPSSPSLSPFLSFLPPSLFSLLSPPSSASLLLSVPTSIQLCKTTGCRVCQISWRCCRCFFRVSVRCVCDRASKSVGPDTAGSGAKARGARVPARDGTKVARACLDRSTSIKR